jgi:hypothetical protein
MMKDMVTVRVDFRESDAEVQDELIAALADELRELELDVTRPAAGPVPDGAKGVAATSVVDLILSGVFSVGTLGALTRVFTEWIKRVGARRVVLEEDGDRLELSGLSRADQKAVIEAWITRRTPDSQDKQDA